MKLLVLCALLFALCFSVHAQNSTCDNILFQERLGDFWDDILYLTEPEPYDGDDQICSFHFQAGDPQCCNDVVYDIVRNVWIRVRARIAIAVILAKEVRRQWEEARDAFRPVRREVDKARDNGTITPEQHTALINFIERVLAAWDKLIDELIDNWARCLTLVLKYWAGVICLGCDPEWDEYIYENPDGHIRLKLSLDTCVKIRQECLPVWVLIFDFISALQDAVDQLRVDLGLEPVNHAAPVCDSDCATWICEVFFAGKDAQTDDLPAPDDQSAKRNAPRIEKFFGHLEAQVTEVFHPHNGAAFVESFSSLLKTTHSAFNALEQVHRQSDGTANEYVTGGYEPIEVGENSGLDMKVDTGSASGLSSWLSYLL